MFIVPEEKKRAEGREEKGRGGKDNAYFLLKEKLCILKFSLNASLSPDLYMVKSNF